MISKIQTLSISCLIAVSWVVAADSSFQAPLVTESLLLDIVKGEKIFVVGERGHILTGSSEIDLGQVSSPSRTTLTAVTTFGQNVWAAGHDASILYSSDNGQTWQIQLALPELDRPFLDILFFDDKSGIAIGAYGLFYRTSDGGKTWVKQLHAAVLPAEDIDYLESIKDDPTFYEEELSFILPHFNRVTFTGSKLYMAGEAGMLAVSADRGESWERFDIDYQGSFFDVKETLAGDLIVVGLRGNIFVKKPNEENWLPIQTCITTSLNSIVVDDNNDIFITGNNGIILSLSRKEIFSSVYQEDDQEGCAMHSSVQKLDSKLSDSVLNGLVINDVMLAVTASGIKKIELK